MWCAGAGTHDNETGALASHDYGAHRGIWSLPNGSCKENRAEAEETCERAIRPPCVAECRNLIAEAAGAGPPGPSSRTADHSRVDPAGPSRRSADQTSWTQQQDRRPEPCGSSSRTTDQGRDELLVNDCLCQSGRQGQGCGCVTVKMRKIQQTPSQRHESTPPSQRYSIHIQTQTETQNAQGRSTKSGSFLCHFKWFSKIKQK